MVAFSFTHSYMNIHTCKVFEILWCYLQGGFFCKMLKALNGGRGRSGSIPCRGWALCLHWIWSVELGLRPHIPPCDSHLLQLGFFHPNRRSFVKSVENDHEYGTDTVFIATQLDDKISFTNEEGDAKTAYDNPLRQYIGFKLNSDGIGSLHEQLKKVKSSLFVPWNGDPESSRDRIFRGRHLFGSLTKISWFS